MNAPTHIATQPIFQGHHHVSGWKRFMDWAAQQDENRLGWLAFSIIGHACIFTNITIGVILATGNHFIYWPVVITVMMVCLVVNLLGLSTKITIPILFGSIIINIVIILLCIRHGIDISTAYR